MEIQCVDLFAHIKSIVVCFCIVIIRTIFAFLYAFDDIHAGAIIMLVTFFCQASLCLHKMNDHIYNKCIEKLSNSDSDFDVAMRVYLYIKKDNINCLFYQIHDIVF